MARNATVTLTAGAWTQLTAGDVTNITFQNLSGVDILLIGTVGATAPTNSSGAIRYGAEQGERNAAIADLFPGVSGATRLYAYCALTGSVMVSHA